MNHHIQVSSGINTEVPDLNRVVFLKGEKTLELELSSTDKKKGEGEKRGGRGREDPIQ